MNTKLASRSDRSDSLVARIGAAGWASKELAVFVLLLLALWELIPRVFGLHRIILPPASEVFVGIVTNFDAYLEQGVITLYEVALGFIAGGLMGFVSGVGIFYSEYLRRAVYPLLFTIRIVPKLAFLPLFLVWFGSGIGTKIAMAATAIFFLVLVQTLLGLTAIDDEYLEYGRSLKMKERQLFTKIRLPIALPSIMVGFKLGIAYAMTNVIVAEMVVAREGLGFLLIMGKQRMRTYEILGAIVVISMIGLALYGLGVLAERRLTYWYYDESDS